MPPIEGKLHIFIGSCSLINCFTDCDETIWQSFSPSHTKKRKMYYSQLIYTFSHSLLPERTAPATCFRRKEARFVLGGTKY